MHVAAYSVALSGDLQQLSDHCLLRGWIAVIELQGIRPAWEVRVPTMREEQVALHLLDQSIVLRRARQFELGPSDVILGVVLHPGMIERGVVGDEVEHQP